MMLDFYLLGGFERCRWDGHRGVGKYNIHTFVPSIFFGSFGDVMYCKVTPQSGMCGFGDDVRWG